MATTNLDDRMTGPSEKANSGIPLAGPCTLGFGVCTRSRPSGPNANRSFLLTPCIPSARGWAATSTRPGSGR